MHTVELLKPGADAQRPVHLGGLHLVEDGVELDVQLVKAQVAVGIYEQGWERTAVGGVAGNGNGQTVCVGLED